MSRVLLLVGLMCGAAICASAQSDSGLNYLRGYVFVAPSPENLMKQKLPAYAAGGGFEQLLWNSASSSIVGGRAPGTFALGAGADFNGVIPGKLPASNTVGIAAFNIYTHYKRWNNLDFFLTGGYALLFRDFAASGDDFGGGVNYWVHENLGVSFEVREEAAVHPPVGVPNHYLELRIGLTFR